MPNPYDVTPQDLEPHRPPPLQQRISNALAALFPKQPQPDRATPTLKSEPQAAPQNDTQNDPAGRALPDANYSYATALYRQYLSNVESNLSRKRRYEEYDAMDNGQIEALLDSIVDSCLISDDGQLRGFKVEADAKYRNALYQVVNDTNLTTQIRAVLRDTLKYGDNFIGYIFDENFNIVGLDNPPPHQMWAFVDKSMRLLTGTEIIGYDTERNPIRVAKAYQQKTDALQTVAGWQPFEMTHLRYKSDARHIYATKSFLEGIRKDWYKINLIEESLVLHRATRSSPRLGHFLDVTGKSDSDAQQSLKDYTEMLNQEKLSNGESVEKSLSVKEDYFFTTNYRAAPDGKLYPSLNNVQFFDPRNTGLQVLPDVEHFTKKMFARVPAEIIGILPDRQDISTQDISASRFYAYLQFVLEHQFLRPLLNLSLLLKGYKPKPFSDRPEENDYKIIFPDVQLRTSWRFADAEFRQSMAFANDVETGINNRKNIARKRYGWTDADWNDHVTEYKSEKSVFAPPESATKTGTGSKAKKTTQIRKGQNSESRQEQTTYVKEVLWEGDDE